MRLVQVWDMADADSELFFHPDDVFLIDKTLNDPRDGNKSKIMGVTTLVCRALSIATQLSNALPSSSMTERVSGESGHIVEPHRTATEVVAILCLRDLVSEFVDKRSY